MIRVVVLTSSAHGTASRCLTELASSDEIEILLVVLAEPAHSTAASRRRKLRKAIKIGFLGALNGIRIRRWFRGESTIELSVLCGELGVPLHRVPSLNSAQTQALFSAANADVGISLGNSYISRKVFSIPRLGMLNLHGERLPEYQNAQSILWPIYNMEATTGLSIHEIDERIDTGRIVYREEFPILFRPTLEATVQATVLITSARAPKAVRFVCEHLESLLETAVPQIAGRKYTTPTIGQFLRMVRNNARLFRLQKPSNI